MIQQTPYKAEPDNDAFGKEESALGTTTTSCHKNHHETATRTLHVKRRNAAPCSELVTDDTNAQANIINKNTSNKNNNPLTKATIQPVQPTQKLLDDLTLHASSDFLSNAFESVPVDTPFVEDVDL